MIVCSCGCQVESFSETVSCSLASYDRDGSKTIAFATYCKQCYQKACSDGDVLFNDQEISLWLNS